VKAKTYFILYVGALIAISTIKSYEPLLIVLAALLLMSGKSVLVISRRSLILVAVFSLFITLSYSVTLYLQHQSFLHYFLTVNLRSFDMIFLTLLFTARVNIYEAVAFSKDLSFLLILSVSKIMSMQRAYADYTDALKSRTLKKPTRHQIYDYLGSAIAGFLDKNIRESKENFEAMKSRGFHV
jgi:cobalt/nickel transport system permease protein